MAAGHFHSLRRSCGEKIRLPEGTQEGVPLGGGDGEAGAVGVLGVADQYPVRQRRDLHAVAALGVGTRGPPPPHVHCCATFSISSTDCPPGRASLRMVSQRHLSCETSSRSSITNPRAAVSRNASSRPSKVAITNGPSK